MNKISLDFFLNNNVQEIAQNLLGKTIYTNFNDKITSAIITETEAYQGPEDKASHAYNNRRTKRTEIMYQRGGCCYVYLCYGVHYLFNIVTNAEEIPHAVLIRSGKPFSGIEHIQSRRGDNIKLSKLLSGPGNFTKGLGINMESNGQLLNNKSIWIEETSDNITFESSPRIGIDYAGKDALLPWRYTLNNC